VRVLLAAKLTTAVALMHLLGTVRRMTTTDAEQQVDVDRELRVVTASSVWLVQSERYARFPRAEAPRPLQTSVDDALEDAVWHEHVGLWRLTNSDGTEQIRILPAGRPPGSYGIATGVIEAEVGS